MDMGGPMGRPFSFASFDQNQTVPRFMLGPRASGRLGRETQPMAQKQPEQRIQKQLRTTVWRSAKITPN
jgi:hypothetical protein